MKDMGSDVTENTVKAASLRSSVQPKKHVHLGGFVTWYFGPQGAHVRLPGFLYTRNFGPHGWSKSRSWRLLGVVALRHKDTEGGALKHCHAPGWTFAFMTIDWKAIKRAIRKADHFVY